MGIKACVAIIVIQTLIKISKRALLAPTSWAIAGTGFCTITIRNLAYPWVVLTTEIWGALALPKGKKQKLTHRSAPNLQ